MTSGGQSFDAPDTPVSKVRQYMATLQRRIRYFLELSMPYAGARWASLGILAVVYLIRMFFLQGWYIVTYALGIYWLNLFLLFLSPKLDPALEMIEDEEEDAVALGGSASSPSGGGLSFLPTRSDDEFRPFIRRLPEFKFWQNATVATLIALFCTFFDAFDVPVFWPILVVYFFLLFAHTMRRQIRHMIKYRYLPFNVGKRRYSATSTGH